MSFTFNAQELLEKMARAGVSGLVDGAEVIATESIDLTPLESGTMRRSHTVTVGSTPDPGQVYEAAKGGREMLKAFTAEGVHPPGSGDIEVFVTVNTPYARKQHEDPTLQHTDGQAKFLETAYNNNVDDVIRLAQLRAAQALREGI